MCLCSLMPVAAFGVKPVFFDAEWIRLLVHTMLMATTTIERAPKVWCSSLVGQTFKGTNRVSNQRPSRWRVDEACKVLRNQSRLCRNDIPNTTQCSCPHKRQPHKSWNDYTHIYLCILQKKMCNDWMCQKPSLILWITTKLNKLNPCLAWACQKVKIMNNMACQRKLKKTNGLWWKIIQVGRQILKIVLRPSFRRTPTNSGLSAEKVVKNITKTWFFYDVFEQSWMHQSQNQFFQRSYSFKKVGLQVYQWHMFEKHRKISWFHTTPDELRRTPTNFKFFFRAKEKHKNKHNNHNHVAQSYHA